MSLHTLAPLYAIAAPGAAPVHAQSATVPSTASTAVKTGTLTVTFAGVETKEGAIMLALYDKAGWVAGTPMRAERIAASGNRVDVEMTGLAAGRYGMKAFHDVNGNGTMDANPSACRQSLTPSPTTQWALAVLPLGATPPSLWHPVPTRRPSSFADTRQEDRRCPTARKQEKSIAESFITARQKYFAQEGLLRVAPVNKATTSVRRKRGSFLF